MSDARGQMTISRLVEIKQEELEAQRIDLRRLQHLLKLEQGRLQEIFSEETALVQEMRRFQEGGERLDADTMVASRRYLSVVRDRLAAQDAICNEIFAQEELVQRELERIYGEIKALERLSERKRTRALQEEKRVGYLRADDQEITRISNARGDYVGH